MSASAVSNTDPSGKRVRLSTGTANRALATEWASKQHAEAFRIWRLGEKPRRRWTEAVTQWLDDHASKRSLKKDLHNFRWLDPFFRPLYLGEITPDLLNEVAAKQRAEPRIERRRKDGTPYTTEQTSQATVDRMLAFIRSVLLDSEERGWISAPPKVELKATGKDEEDYRWLSKQEAERLYAELAEHLRPMFRFALATCWREQNVLRLEWGRIDLDRKVAWVKGAQAKAKKAIGAPLNQDAVDILRGRLGKHPRWVFPNETGEPFDRANNRGYKAAQHRAKIEPLTWHDLRHTWANWHVMAGTSLRALMELGGWRSYKSVLRYAHLSPEHLANDASRVEGIMQTDSGTKKPKCKN